MMTYHYIYKESDKINFMRLKPVQLIFNVLKIR
jgi:hypothetical protein